MTSDKTFWGHLDVVRGVIVRCLIVVSALACTAFFYKDFIFSNIIFAPSRPDFITFDFLRKLADLTGIGALNTEIKPVKLINTELAAQLFTHLSVSFYAGITLAVPWITAELWIFIRPALKPAERKAAIKAVLWAVLLFFIGVMFAWIVILPLSINFLADYHVDSQVENLISLSSYIDTFVSLVPACGLLFELPAITWFLAKIGLLKYKTMKKWRKHAFVVSLVVAAIITPSTDAFTMFLVAMPMQILFEAGLLIVKRINKPIESDIEH